MKTGLILEGGGMRGMFTAGVTDVMMEAGVEFDGAIGVSAGAAFGCNYKSGQIGRAFRYNVNYCADKRYSGIGVLLREGNLFSKSFCYEELPVTLDPFDFAAFKQNPMEFYLVCTDVETGKPVYHRYEGWEDNGFEWFRATTSMPLVSQIVEIGGRKLLDGGISDSVPIQFFNRIGYDRNVVILTQPRGYTKKKNSLLPLMKLWYRKYPNLVETIQNRHTEYNETLAYIRELEHLGSLLVICPEEPLNISRASKDPAELKRVYHIGRNTAVRHLDAIKAFLNESNHRDVEKSFRPIKGE